MFLSQILSAGLQLWLSVSSTSFPDKCISSNHFHSMFQAKKYGDINVLGNVCDIINNDGTPNP